MMKDNLEKRAMSYPIPTMVAYYAIYHHDTGRIRERCAMNWYGTAAELDEEMRQRATDLMRDHGSIRITYLAVDWSPSQSDLLHLKTDEEVLSQGTAIEVTA